MIKRWWLYINETFHPISRLLYSIMICTGIFFMMHPASDGKKPILATGITFGVLSFVLLILYWRIIDEFKDVEVDRMFFKDRPVPSGRISLYDLKILKWVVIVILFCINILWNIVLFEFIVLFIYAYLIEKWFFIEKILSNNRILTFLTHAPISILANFYIIAIYCATLNETTITVNNFIIALWFALPSFTWEIARKTKAPADEIDGYQTYSQMLGYKNATILSILFIVIQWVLMIIFKRMMGINTSFIIYNSILILIYSYISVQFILQPKKYSKAMLVFSELYTLFCFIGLITYYSLTYGVVWKWKR